MRIWDIHPGYLNRQSLLGEHRELHGIVSIIVNNKKGYANHPETLRWLEHGWALTMRHRLLAAEMALRHYTDRSPVALCANPGIWPEEYIDEPALQLSLLEEKYRHTEQGRIPLPQKVQQLWSHHKYSLLARDESLYRKIGKDVAANPPGLDFQALARLLTERLRTAPTMGGIRNALQHMWGYVSKFSSAGPEVATWSATRLLHETQRHARAGNAPYLLASTALSEFHVWIEENENELC